jgi:hypothetical protein
MSREVTLWIPGRPILHAKGYEVDELEEVLRLAKRVIVIDTKPPDAERLADENS